MKEQKSPTPIRINSKLEDAIMKVVKKTGSSKHAVIIDALETHFKAPNKNYLTK